MTKEEFRKRYKALVKKYHPDLAGDEEDRKRKEELMTRINRVYETLKNKAVEAPGSERRATVQQNPARKNALRTVAEQDYVYYKMGVKHFMDIHPSTWNPSWSMLSHVTSERELDKLLESIEYVHKCFYVAEHCFKTILEQFPASKWISDARDKYEELLKKKKRWERIEQDLLR